MQSVLEIVVSSLTEAKLVAACKAAAVKTLLRVLRLCKYVEIWLESVVCIFHS